MSDLTNTERRKLERVLGIGSGYVLNFSNRTLEEFVLDSVGIEIYDAKYEYGSGSKANRMRRFWEVEPNYIVGKLLGDMLGAWDDICGKPYNPETGQHESPRFPDDCVRIIERLKADSPVPEIDSLKPNLEDKDFEALARSVKEYIRRNEPETGLDRLHTFVVKYVRALCAKHGMCTDKEKPLHSAFGEYIKTLSASGEIETEMTSRILKSSISLLDSFNNVRNQHSQAHDNRVVGYQEALLIFNSVVGLIRFLDHLESKSGKPPKVCDDDIPF